MSDDEAKRKETEAVAAGWMSVLTGQAVPQEEAWSMRFKPLPPTSPRLRTTKAPRADKETGSATVEESTKVRARDLGYVAFGAIRTQAHKTRSLWTAQYFSREVWDTLLASARQQDAYDVHQSSTHDITFEEAKYRMLYVPDGGSSTWSMHKDDVAAFIRHTWKWQKDHPRPSMADIYQPLSEAEIANAVSGKGRG